jgi:hypothetical protein
VMGESIYTADERARMTKPHGLNTPFADVMPSLSAEQYAELKSGIEQSGLAISILVDEDNNIIDGHHRYRACSELGVEFRTELISGIGDHQAKRMKIRALNLAVRNLSVADRERLRREQKDDALRLLASGRGIREVGKLVGRPQSTIHRWKEAVSVPPEHSPQPKTTNNKPSPTKATNDTNVKKNGDSKMTSDDATALKQRVLGLHRSGIGNRAEPGNDQ